MDSMQKTKSDYLILKDSQVWFLSFYSTPKHISLNPMII